MARSDSAGNVISRTSYEPYGRTASGVTPTIGFTGHVNDADTGLVHMQQRYYDPVAGRFLSVDPVVTDASTGSSFNRYAYAINSPYNYIDPDGRNVAVIVNRNTPLIGDHVGLFVQRGKRSVLYDPGGSYRNDIKGSGDLLEGKDANLKKYVDYQLLDGKKVDVFIIATSQADDDAIIKAMEEYGGGSPGTCAISSANVLRGIGPFKNLGSTITPNGMASAINSLPNGTIRRWIPGEGNINDPTTQPKKSDPKTSE